MKIEIDHPKVRASENCPICRGNKDLMLVVCWHCYKEHGLKYGNPEIERIIEQAEIQL